MLTRVRLLWLTISSVFLVGTLGFRFIEDYPWFDAFYMTLTTITTVGYGEVHPLSNEGRIFNSFLIFFGVGVTFQVIAVVAQAVIEREFAQLLGFKRSKKMLDSLQDHFVICGFGRVGRGAALEMQRSKVPFVVVDTSAERVERASRLGMLAVNADCTRDETLHQVKIAHARGLVAALATDADNMYVILSARSLNPLLVISARANEDESEQKLRRAGADMVFAPYNLTGNRLAQSILRPHVQEFLDIFTRNIGLNASMEQVQVQPGCEFDGKSLKELQLRRELGVIVLAIRRSTGKMEFNPSADSVIEPNDYLIVMGEAGGLRRLEGLLIGAKA